MTVKTSFNVYGVIPDENTFILTYYMPIFVDRNIFTNLPDMVKAAILNFAHKKFPPRVQALHPVVISLVGPN